MAELYMWHGITCELQVSFSWLCCIVDVWLSLDVCVWQAIQTACRRVSEYRRWRWHWLMFRPMTVVHFNHLDSVLPQSVMCGWLSDYFIASVTDDDWRRRCSVIVMLFADVVAVGSWQHCFRLGLRCTVEPRQSPRCKYEHRMLA